MIPPILQAGSAPGKGGGGGGGSGSGLIGCFTHWFLVGLEGNKGT